MGRTKHSQIQPKSPFLKLQTSNPNLNMYLRTYEDIKSFTDALPVEKRRRYDDHMFSMKVPLSQRCANF